MFGLLIGGFILSLGINLYYFFRERNMNIVVKVVDGDSLDLSDGRRIRLLGIDAPEREKCAAYKAKEKLIQLALNKRIRLRNVVTDDYGRILANVYVGNILVNKILVAQGLAKFVYVKSPVYEEMKKAQDYARSQKLGIYSPACRKTSPQLVGCDIKGNNREGKKTYHLPNCPNYKEVIIDESYGDQWFCTEDEAIAVGFQKTHGCK